MAVSAPHPHLHAAHLTIKDHTQAMRIQIVIINTIILIMRTIIIIIILVIIVMITTV